MTNDDDLLKDVPLTYKLLAKFPKLSLEGFPEKFQGIFWAVILPTMLVGYFFLNIMLLVSLPSPLNIVVVASVASLIFLSILRIYFERALNSRRALLQEPNRLHWDIEGTVEEYLDFCNKQKNKRSRG